MSKWAPVLASEFDGLLFQDVYDARGELRRWVHRLAKKSGFYVIQRKALLFPEVVYVGESHTNNLKKTLLRHFQEWKGKTAGPTYSRSKVEVAFVICSSGTAVERQNEAIRHFQPKDNTIAKEEPKEKNPF